MSLIQILPSVKGKYREGADLSKMCWFKTGGLAEVLFIPEDLQDLQNFLRKKPIDIPHIVIGLGSNLLVRDTFVNGVVIRLGRGFNYISHTDNFQIIAGAASVDANVAIYAMEYEIGNLEFLSGIPGSIGGALAMNAGCYGSDIASVLIEAKAINADGETRIFSQSEIGYYYRGKALSSNWLFVEAKFQGEFSDKEKMAAKIKIIQERRACSQPIKSKTGGSTFKNPIGYKAWELIDKSGCRGLKIGGAQISDQHCNFIINNGNASSNDIESLILEVQAIVFRETGIKLETEIKIIPTHYGL